MHTLDVTTPDGPGRLTLDAPSDDEPRGILLLGHGAGGGIETPDLDAIASLLPVRCGVLVARYEQPWRVAGRKVAGPPASLDRGWLPVVDAVREAFPGIPLIVGGRSAGARVACRWARTGDCAGVLALSFPLHAPGKPEKSRLDELASVPVPVRIVSGDRDPFGSPDEFNAALATPQEGERSYVPIAGQAHSFRTLKRDAVPAGVQVAAAAAEFVDGLLGG